MVNEVPRRWRWVSAERAIKGTRASSVIEGLLLRLSVESVRLWQTRLLIARLSMPVEEISSEESEGSKRRCAIESTSKGTVERLKVTSLVKACCVKKTRIRGEKSMFEVWVVRLRVVRGWD